MCWVGRARGCILCVCEQIAWNDETNPALGFKYLYLTPEDYEALEDGTVNAREVMVEGEKRYELTDIIGQVREERIGEIEEKKQSVVIDTI